jgi:hypothetical protein
MNFVIHMLQLLSFCKCFGHVHGYKKSMLFYFARHMYSFVIGFVSKLDLSLDFKVSC